MLGLWQCHIRFSLVSTYLCLPAAMLIIEQRLYTYDKYLTVPLLYCTYPFPPHTEPVVLPVHLSNGNVSEFTSSRVGHRSPTTVTLTCFRWERVWPLAQRHYNGHVVVRVIITHSIICIYVVYTTRVWRPRYLATRKCISLRH